MLGYFVYIMASGRYGTLYTAVTSELLARVYRHKTGHFGGFTDKYRVRDLVWFEAHDDARAAIQREKTMKQWPHDWKINLIERGNPEWRDLYDGFVSGAMDARDEPGHENSF